MKQLGIYLIIGIYLLIGGIGSIVLNQFGYEFTLLSWIDNWSETVGWAILGAAIVIGAVLFAVGMKQESSVVSEEQNVVAEK